jgi:NADP-dependent aldehyde dehydrogenase
VNINGAILIGSSERQSESRFEAFDASTGEALQQLFSEAGAEDIEAACVLAANAAQAFGAMPLAERATFLDAVADAIFDIGDELVVTAMRESGLPRVRLEGERMRTINQLKLFAGELRDGTWLDVTIDTALPDRNPPRADLRRINVPLGPVAVFGASNFPLAFSVAGGDTASALAAGCPVVVKGHPAHPATGELVARAVGKAIAECGLHEGVFSYLPGRSHELGSALIADPRIKAVGFTGSRSGGLALCRIAAQRCEPIPVYAEMSSINPVVLMPAALEARAESLANAFVSSLTLGAGQFCTNPGLVLAIESPALAKFIEAAKAALGALPPQAMLTPGIHSAYRDRVAALDAHAGVTRIASGAASDGTPSRCPSALFLTDAANFVASPELSEEVFGASSVIVRCADVVELAAAIAVLEGQLTATLQMDAGDVEAAAAVLAQLQAKVGRVLVNGWPTGVEVTWAMIHGGPFPATSDARSTSVGTLAIMRFVRPICFQDMPPALLPAPLADDNPWRLPRRVNGDWQR